MLPVCLVLYLLNWQNNYGFKSVPFLFQTHIYFIGYTCIWLAHMNKKHWFYKTKSLLMYLPFLIVEGMLPENNMICILYGFTCEMDFSHHKSSNPARVACDESGIRREVVRNPSHMENHTKCIFSHTLHIYHRHFNQAKYNVQSCRSWKPYEMDLSHNCSLHGGRSEVCANVFPLAWQLVSLSTFSHPIQYASIPTWVYLFSVFPHHPFLELSSTSQRGILAPGNKIKLKYTVSRYVMMYHKQ